MNNTIEHICTLCETLARATNRYVSTISRLSTGSGDTVRRLKNGRRITTDRAFMSLENLSRMWPQYLPWPADIPRPPCSKDDAA